MRATSRAKHNSTPSATTGNGSKIDVVTSFDCFLLVDSRRFFVILFFPILLLPFSLSLSFTFFFFFFSGSFDYENSCLPPQPLVNAMFGWLALRAYTHKHTHPRVTIYQTSFSISSSFFFFLLSEWQKKKPNA